jgi:hypothetical protein
MTTEHWIDLGLSVLTALASYWAKAKSGQAASHAEVAATLIRAIEGMASPAAVKAAVRSESVRSLNSDKVDAVVQSVTDKP